jgi:hypothetical protein
MLQDSKYKAGAALALVVAAIVGFAGAASAQAVEVGDQVTTSLQDWSDQALAMVPAALAAGLALFGVAILIGFGKRIFRSAA